MTVDGLTRIKQLFGEEELLSGLVQEASRIERDLGEAAVMSGWSIETIREVCRRECEALECTFEDALDEFRRLASVIYLADSEEEVKSILENHKLNWWEKRRELVKIIRKEERNA